MDAYKGFGQYKTLEFSWCGKIIFFDQDFGLFTKWRQQHHNSKGFTNYYFIFSLYEKMTTKVW